MNPVFLDLGAIRIYWYSVLLFVAFFIGGALALHESKKWKIPEDFMINLFFWMVPCALVGARLYFVLFHLDYYSQHILDIFKVWEGGLAIHGGIIAAFLCILVYAKKYKVKVMRLTDILVVSLILGQAIGRWGNFFNMEAYGPQTTLAFLQGLHLPKFIIDGMFINGAYYHPTFLYESLWCFLGFFVLYFIRKYRYIKLGQTTSVYLVWYGIGRFFIEGLRTDSLMLGSYKIAQIVSLVMIAAGIISFFAFLKSGRFRNHYHDMEDINEIRF